MGSDLVVEHRAFPLRPAPAADVPFKGTYREEGWRRCNQMSAGDGITFTPWPHAALPGWKPPSGTMVQASRIRTRRPSTASRFSAKRRMACG